ncbi:MAG: hypothetical protein ACK514_10300 [Bacteroidota bacterium]|nr:hypothetical protein [Cytophagales bacterium]MCE2958167.1 hypothetical protein [Flammeovirgaceae bacterium]MCZ8069993.1 hypothetical protein [Cytophagales bacterium]
MKRLIIAAFLVFESHIWLCSQSMKEKLQGEWLCHKIETRDGVDVGLSDYLRYSFRGSNLYISNNPIDRGGFQPIKYTKKGFDFLHGAFTIQSFEVQVHGKDSLEITTTTDSGLILHYSFINQFHFKENGEQNPTRRIYRFKVVIFDKASVFDKLKQIPSYKSNLTNDILPSTKKTLNSFLAPPWFKRHEGESFGTYFNSEFSLKSAYNVDSVDNCVAIDLNVTHNGLSDLRIVNRVNYEVSSQIFFILEKSKKLWKLPKERELPPTVPLRLEFEIVAGEKNINAVSPKH